MTHSRNKIEIGGGRHHPRRRRAAFWARVRGDIIRAGGALCGVGGFRAGDGIGLSRRSGTLEFVAEVLKVFLADLQLQYFFDHRREVCQ